MIENPLQKWKPDNRTWKGFPGFEIPAMMWMDPEFVIQCEVRQKEKNKCHVNTYGWNLERWCRWACLQGRARDTDVENHHVDTGDGKAEKDWHVHPPREQRRASGACVQPGELSSGLCGDSGVGRGCGREFPAGGDIGLHIPGSLVVQQKRTQHCKAIILWKKKMHGWPAYNNQTSDLSWSDQCGKTNKNEYFKLFWAVGIHI